MTAASEAFSTFAHVSTFALFSTQLSCSIPRDDSLQNL